jgi:hypothetical protein
MNLPTQQNVCNFCVCFFFICKTSLSSVHLSYSSLLHTLVLLYFTELSFLCCFRVEFVNVFFRPRFDFCTCTSDIFLLSTNNFTHAQTLSRISSLSGHINIARVNIEFFTGCKKIKQRRISLILGYLRMILWKISTAISIKHRILATFNIKKNQFWQLVCL